MAERYTSTFRILTLCSSLSIGVSLIAAFAGGQIAAPQGIRHPGSATEDVSDALIREGIWQ